MQKTSRNTNDNRRPARSWRRSAALALAIGGVLMTGGCTASESRAFKTAWSEINGLQRTVTLYDYNGEVLKTWQGRFDIQEDSNKTMFDDDNNKRIIIKGGIVVVEED